MNRWQKRGERLDSLELAGMSILQRPDGFRFGTDAVLLSRFARVKGVCRVADLGTGTGILPLLISARADKAAFTAIEIQRDAAEMAARSVAMNGLNGRVRVICADMRGAAAFLGCGSFDVTLCNPPYGRAGGTYTGDAETRAIARHEVTCTLDDVATAMSALTRNGGRACVVHQALRLAEVFERFAAHRLTVKRVRLVHPRPSAPAQLALVEASKNGGAGVEFQPPIYVMDENGAFTPQLTAIYAGTDA